MPRRLTRSLVALALAGLLVAPASTASALPTTAPAATAADPTAADPTAADPTAADPTSGSAPAEDGTADATVDPGAVPLEADEITPEIATEVLETAVEAVNGEVVDEVSGGTEAPTMALRDLVRVLPRLTTSQQEVAGRILARPTESVDPELGVGYTTDRVAAACAANVCVHLVTDPTNVDYTTPQWALETQRTMQRVFAYETGTLGYRAPPADGNRGGNAKYDIYLADLGELDLFGYCVPEQLLSGYRATSYCVLDNDYRRAQYGYVDPRAPLQVTAAHEFFHAIQYGYTVNQDGWLYESTATWIEERFAPNVNDNWRYLRGGVLTNPLRALDAFGEKTGAAYGNWIFWEYVAARFGDRIVRTTWETATGSGHSVRALETALHYSRDPRNARGNLANELAGFAAANLYPAQHYRDGRYWGVASPVQRYHRLTARHSSTSLIQTAIVPQTTTSTMLVPDASLGSQRLRLRVRLGFTRPGNASVAAVAIVETKDGRISRVPLTQQAGSTTAYLPFSPSSVRRVTLTFATGSSSYLCSGTTDRACSGRPMDYPTANYDLRVERY